MRGLFAAVLLVGSALTWSAARAEDDLVIRQNTTLADRRTDVETRLCMWDKRFDELKVTEDATDTALAKLSKTDCERTDRISGLDPDQGTLLSNIDLVDSWLAKLRAGAEVGTDMGAFSTVFNVALTAAATLGSVTLDPLTATAARLFLVSNGLCATEFDYDVGLIGLVRLLYQFGPAEYSSKIAAGRIQDGTFNHALDNLLTQRGGAKLWRTKARFCGFDIPVDETENHQLMTESSRYLTNQLLRLRHKLKGNPATFATATADWDNTTNGLKQAILQKLSDILADDFFEYNSRPYARLSAKAIENLYDFAADIEVRRAAHIMLDFLSAKFAVSNMQMRRAAPFRRRSEWAGVDDFYGARADQQTPRFLALVGQGQMPPKGMTPEGVESMIFSVQGRYAVPVQMLADMTRTDRSFSQRFRHGGYELYVAGRDFLISAGGVFRPGASSPGTAGAVVAAVELASGVPTLGVIVSLAGISFVIDGFAEANTAIAMPTTLLLSNDLGLLSQSVRIEGRNDREDRNNTCVVEPGFACGYNLKIPDTPMYAAGCRREIGEWTFFNLSEKTASGCQDRGLIIITRRKACEGDCPSGTSNFGFFHVLPTSQDLTFSFVVKKTLELNASSAFSASGNSRYVPLNGPPDIIFEVGAPVDTWPIVPQAAHNTTDRSMRTWLGAEGVPVRKLYDGKNGWRRSCVEYLSFSHDQRLILDLSRPEDPGRCFDKLSGFQRYGCARERCPASDQD